MLMKRGFSKYLAALAVVLGIGTGSPAAVIINEFMYDDSSTDDREFVELYNNGNVTESIGGWTLSGRDPTGANSSVTITAGTMLAPGAYYVIGQTGVLNVNQVVTTTLENDNETLELSDGSGVLQDAVAYETNKGITFAAPVAGQLGPGVFGNHTGSDVAGTPLNATVSMGRFVDGRDTDNNGRDFGMRPSTPGTNNAPVGYMTSYVPPSPNLAALGSELADTAASFVNVKVIDPTLVDTVNPNAIAAPPAPNTKAYAMWDPSGGGDGATTKATFDTTMSSFAITAYLSTDDLPVQSNAQGVQFRGSEVTIYGIGGGDAFTNLTDLTGAIGLTSVALPAAESGNGFTGVAWVYEKVGLTPAGGPVSELLHLVDANDGGDSQPGGNTPLDWTILQTIDLSTTPSGWFELGIDIDSAGNGVARFNGTAYNFVTSTSLNGAAFNVGYRENLQIGADGTPDAIMRPATFVPEPTMAIPAALICMGAALLRRRRA